MDKRFCVVIPTCRKPPLVTLREHNLSMFKVFLLCDPDVVTDHCQWLAQAEDMSHVVPVVGVKGLGAQIHLGYMLSAVRSFQHFAKIDDDLPAATLRGRDGQIIDLAIGLTILHECLLALDVTMAGFQNSIRPNWMGHGYKRTYGIIHGGANMCASSLDADRFIDPSLLRATDTYQTCAHRLHDFNRGNDGSCGRVCHIGFDKSLSTRQHTVSQDPTIAQSTRQLILDKFGDMVSFPEDWEGNVKVRFRRLKRKA